MSDGHTIPAHIENAIAGERAYQDRKWGSPHEHPHEVGAWLTIMRHKLLDAEAAWTHGLDDHDALKEVLKVVAVGVACLEQHGVVTRDNTYNRHIST